MIEDLSARAPKVTGEAPALPGVDSAGHALVNKGMGTAGLSRHSPMEILTLVKSLKSDAQRGFVPRSPNKAALLPVRLCPAVRHPTGWGTARAGDRGVSESLARHYLGDDGGAHLLDRGTVLRPAASCFSFWIALFWRSCAGLELFWPSVISRH